MSSENNSKNKNDIKHNKAASESFLGSTTAISKRKVIVMANNCMIAIKRAKKPKSTGLKNLVNIGNNNKGIS